MPQINQLSEIFFSQLFWLVVVFGIIYFVIGRGMVPKIRGTVGAREAQIAADLQHAQSAREDADRTEANWRARMDVARVEASRVTNEAKQSSAAKTEAMAKAAAEEISLRVQAAEDRIKTAVAAARGEIESLAAEVAQEMVRRLTGVAVDQHEAAAAIKGQFHD